jgi:hypothetical protein
MEVQINYDQIIDKLVEVELKVAKLYGIYAKKFPQYSQFWLDTLEDEKLHAKRLKMLNSFFSEGSELGRMVLDRFSLDLIKSTLDTIENLIHETQYPDFTIQQALNAAYEIENSVIEDKLYEVFDTDNDELKQILGLIKEETLRHTDKIRHLQNDIS